MGSAQSGQKKVCKAALVNLEEPTAAIFRDAFKQFRIQAVDVTTKQDHRLGDERFDACVLRLLPGCEPILEGLRGSRRDKNIIVYAIAMPGLRIHQISKFGINVLLNDPVDRQTVTKVVRASHLLVLHEFRRYARVPVVTEVQLRTALAMHEAASVELSGGGMSLRADSNLEIGKRVEVSFTLPSHKEFLCNATVCWSRPERKMLGVRFDPADQRRDYILRWIDDYLSI